MPCGSPPDEWALTIFGQEDRHQEPGGMRWLLEGRLIALAVDALRLRPSVVLDLARQFWPSLAQSLNGRLVER